MATLAEVVPPPPETVHLDAVDRHILVLLARDSRISRRRLARELRMSPPAIGERIARLESAGIIRGYTVAIDWSVLGFVTCYLAVSATQGAELGPVMRALHQLPEVEQVMVITGSLDMLVRVRVRNHAHLRRLLLEHVWQVEGVQRTETFLSLAEMPVKETTASLLDIEEPAPGPGQEHGGVG